MATRQAQTVQFLALSEDVPTCLRLDRIADRFEAAWRSGSVPRIEDYLGEVPASDRAQLVRELVGIDMDYRRLRGENPKPADYDVWLLATGGKHVTDRGDSMVERMHDRPSTSSSLLARLRSMEPAAWEQMTGLYYPLVYGWSVRAGLQPSDAADVAQEVFRAVAAGIGGFVRAPAGGTFRGWLAGITRHKVQDHWRQRQRQPQAEGGSAAQRRLAEVPLDCPDETGETDPATGLALLVRQAAELIRPDFEDRTWQAFWRVTVDDQSPADVAAELGMSVNSVYLAKSRVLRRLREELGDQDA